RLCGSPGRPGFGEAHRGAAGRSCRGAVRPPPRRPRNAARSSGFRPASAAAWSFWRKTFFLHRSVEYTLAVVRRADAPIGGGSAVARLVGLLNRGHRLGRQERVSCVEYRGFGLPQWAPSVEFTEGYLYDRPIGPRSST